MKYNGKYRKINFFDNDCDLTEHFEKSWHVGLFLGVMQSRCAEHNRTQVAARRLS